MSIARFLRSFDRLARRDLVQDALGASALVVMLMVGLYLPVLV